MSAVSALRPEGQTSGSRSTSSRNSLTACLSSLPSLSGRQAQQVEVQSKLREQAGPPVVQQQAAPTLEQQQEAPTLEEQQKVQQNFIVQIISRSIDSLNVKILKTDKTDTTKKSKYYLDSLLYGLFPDLRDLKTSELITKLSELKAKFSLPLTEQINDNINAFIPNHAQLMGLFSNNRETYSALLERYFNLLDKFPRLYHHDRPINSESAILYLKVIAEPSVRVVNKPLIELFNNTTAKIKFPAKKNFLTPTQNKGIDPETQKIVRQFFNLEFSNLLNNSLFSENPELYNFFYLYPDNFIRDFAHYLYVQTHQQAKKVDVKEKFEQYLSELIKSSTYYAFKQAQDFIKAELGSSILFSESQEKTTTLARDVVRIYHVERQNVKTVLINVLSEGLETTLGDSSALSDLQNLLILDIVEKLLPYLSSYYSSREITDLQSSIHATALPRYTSFKSCRIPLAVFPGNNQRILQNPMIQGIITALADLNSTNILAIANPKGLSGSLALEIQNLLFTSLNPQNSIPVQQPVQIQQEPAWITTLNEIWTRYSPLEIELAELQGRFYGSNYAPNTPVSLGDGLLTRLSDIESSVLQLDIPDIESANKVRTWETLTYVVSLAKLYHTVQTTLARTNDLDTKGTALDQAEASLLALNELKDKSAENQNLYNKFVSYIDNERSNLIQAREIQDRERQERERQAREAAGVIIPIVVESTFNPRAIIQNLDAIIKNILEGNYKDGSKTIIDLTPVFMSWFEQTNKVDDVYNHYYALYNILTKIVQYLQAGKPNNQTCNLQEILNSIKEFKENYPQSNYCSQLDQLKYSISNTPQIQKASFKTSPSSSSVMISQAPDQYSNPSRSNVKQEKFIDNNLSNGSIRIYNTQVGEDDSIDALLEQAQGFYNGILKYHESLNYIISNKVTPNHDVKKAQYNLFIILETLKEIDAHDQNENIYRIVGSNYARYQYFLVYFELFCKNATNFEIAAKAIQEFATQVDPIGQNNSFPCAENVDWLVNQFNHKATCHAQKTMVNPLFYRNGRIEEGKWMTFRGKLIPVVQNNVLPTPPKGEPNNSVPQTQETLIVSQTSYLKTSTRKFITRTNTWRVQ